MTKISHYDKLLLIDPRGNLLKEITSTASEDRVPTVSEIRSAAYNIHFEIQDFFKSPAMENVVACKLVGVVGNENFHIKGFPNRNHPVIKSRGVSKTQSDFDAIAELEGYLTISPNTKLDNEYNFHL